MKQNIKKLKNNNTGVISSSLYTAIAFVFFGSTRFGFNIILQLVYGTSVVGNYNLVLSIALIAPLFITSILNVPLTKFASEARGKNDKQEFLFFIGIIFRLLLITTIVSSIIYYLTYSQIARYFNINVDVFKLGLPIIFFYTIYHFFRRMYYIVDKVKIYMIIEIIASVLFFISLFICIKGHNDNFLLIPMVLQMCFVSVVSVVVFFPYLKQIDWTGHSSLYKKNYKIHSKKLFSYAAITGIGSGLSAVSMHIFTIILGKTVDIKSVGHFALIRTTSDPASYLFRIMGVVNFPKIAYIYGRGDFRSLKTFVRDKSKKFFIFTSLMFLPIILLSPYFSKFLFKEETTSGLIILFILMLLSHYVRTITVFHLNFLSATRYPLIPNIIGPFSIFAVIPFIPIAFNTYGPGGLGILIILAAVVRFIFILTFGEKKLMEI